jgi:hypothetical protein
VVIQFGIPNDTGAVLGFRLCLQPAGKIDFPQPGMLVHFPAEEAAKDVPGAD